MGQPFSSSLLSAHNYILILKQSNWLENEYSLVFSWTRWRSPAWDSLISFSLAVGHMNSIILSFYCRKNVGHRPGKPSKRWRGREQCSIGWGRDRNCQKSTRSATGWAVRERERLECTPKMIVKLEREKEKWGVCHLRTDRLPLSKSNLKNWFNNMEFICIDFWLNKNILSLDIEKKQERRVLPSVPDLMLPFPISFTTGFFLHLFVFDWFSLCVHDMENKRWNLTHFHRLGKLNMRRFSKRVLNCSIRRRRWLIGSERGWRTRRKLSLRRWVTHYCISIIQLFFHIGI